MTELVTFGYRFRAVRDGQFIKDMTPMMPPSSTWPAAMAMHG
ncbi:3-dehydroquinate dehydratase [Roseovarius sp. 217]|nr:3-dehydroquinate dehydratase [Roseovarius sp. 217]